MTDLPNIITLRDWFAGQALAGMYSASHSQMVVMKAEAEEKGELRQSETFAREAYEVADAMLKQRAKHG